MIERKEPAARVLHPRPRAALIVGLVLIALCGAVLYGMSGSGKDAAAACPAAAAASARIDPLIHGEVAALALARPARSAPDLSFDGPDGKSLSLADFHGKTILVNFWATWCIPCRQEMPALDRLEAELGGKDFEVVAVNVDTARLDRPKIFLKGNGVTSLAFYADPTANVLQALREDGQPLGLPTTLLIDRNGCELARMAGPAAWSSFEAERLIAAAKS